MVAGAAGNGRVVQGPLGQAGREGGGSLKRLNRFGRELAARSWAAGE
jgi:hypothetical protein